TLQARGKYLALQRHGRPQCAGNRAHEQWLDLLGDQPAPDCADGPVQELAWLQAAAERWRREVRERPTEWTDLQGRRMVLAAELQQASGDGAVDLGQIDVWPREGEQLVDPGRGDGRRMAQGGQLFVALDVPGEADDVGGIREGRLWQPSQHLGIG